REHANLDLFALQAVVGIRGDLRHTAARGRAGARRRGRWIGGRRRWCLWGRCGRRRRTASYQHKTYGHHQPVSLHLGTSPRQHTCLKASEAEIGMALVSELVAITMMSSGRVDIYSGVQRLMGRIYGQLVRPDDRPSKTALIITHPASAFLGHYLLRPLAEAGV